jgi:VCBS repeat-containing protein
MLDGAGDDQGRSHFSAGAFHDELRAGLQPTGDSGGKTAGIAGHFRTEHASAPRTADDDARSRALVVALAGHAASVDHAAANVPSQPSSQVIGRAVKIEGHVLVVRNGVAMALNTGDVLRKGDIVQTSGDGEAGLVFKDGSVFQIGHDSRLALTEFSYDQHGTANLEVFNLLQGSFSFASGVIARTGEMRVGTPVASAKILGSAGAGDVAASDGAITLSVFHQEDGLHQAAVLDSNGDPIGTISSDGGKLRLTMADSSLAADEQAKTDADRAFETDALNRILQVKNLAGHYEGSATIGAHGSSIAPIGSTNQGQGPPAFHADPFFIYIPPASLHGDEGTNPHPNDTVRGGLDGQVTFGPVNQAPQLHLHAGSTPVAAVEQTSVAVVPGLTLSDNDSTTLLQATVSITGNFQPGEDTLSFADTALIHGQFDAGTGVLTLRAVAGQAPTLVDFQAALRTVTYTYAGDAPSGPSRTLTVTVQDPDGTAHGGHDLASESVVLSVTAVNDAPALRPGEISFVALEQTATSVAPGLTLSDVDSATLHHASLQITGNYLRGEDVLSFAGTALIQGSFDAATGTLILTARPGQSPTVADFEAALRSVTYIDSSDNPSPLTRTLTITLQDADGTAHGGHDTSVGTVTLTVTAVNDPPAITGETDPSAVAELSDAHAQSVGPITGTLSASDRDIGDVLTGHVAMPGAVSYSGGALPAGVDINALRDAAAISFDSATTTISGANTLTWTYHPAATNLDWLAAGETLTITYLAEVTDGTARAGNQPLTITITGTNDAPTIVAAQVAGTVTEDVAAGAQSLLHAGGSFDFTDLDLSDAHSASATFLSTTAAGGVALGTMDAQDRTDTVDGIGGEAGWNYHVDNGATPSPRSRRPWRAPAATAPTP